ncbi:MAG: hypothetical protein QW112_01240 [Candidatus Micrarchaeia archaeon]
MKRMDGDIYNGYKGQISLETIIVVGFVLTLMAPLLYILYTRITELQQEILLLEAKRAVDMISNTISSVGVIGPNGTAVIEVTFPANMKNLTIGGPENREVVMVVSTTLGEIDIPRVLYFNITEAVEIPRKPGTHKIKVVYPETGPIRISPA